MRDFFIGLAVAFALLLFLRRGGAAGLLAPSAPGAPFNPRLAGPMAGTPAPPGGMGGTGGGCGCASLAALTPPPPAQTVYGNVAPGSPPGNLASPSQPYTRFLLGTAQPQTPGSYTNPAYAPYNWRA